MKLILRAAFPLLSAAMLSSCTTEETQTASAAESEVQVVGAMRNVMWKGELAGTIDLDTIAGKEQLYGLGPVEYLAGELLILDGNSHKSVVINDSTMRVEETFASKAPFFVYARVSNWTAQALPDSIRSLPQLELYLDSVTQNSKRPFPFKVSGKVAQATIHIVNLPAGSKVSSPDEAHRGQVNYALRDEAVDILGFFSTEHKAVFTHHDTFMHLHLITRDRSKMGHLDEATFQPGTLTLYLPAQ
ncbi:acetolactate decarboxylase [Pontibacter sp. BT731]|uniref:acetolactate decarboxylase n=1 Tax=Pontibacter coccineus TaxID=3063328 RepID=UPI0026E35192|nr:acetolactate decarboxylase [Pontibacter sp. BT731]MDO6391505.1 acetolactate decarboxylase [Pontibacter sp. BT731]